jgi:GT2 family glycosyltransferase
MITTRNRVAELRRTLKELDKLEPAPLEILVTADSCTDGTVHFLRKWCEGGNVERLEGLEEVRGQRSVVGDQMSEIEDQGADIGGTVRRVFVNETGLGSVGSRDRMMREARGDLVLAVDDDSYPEQRDCLETLGRIFASNPLLAILDLPQRTDEYPDTLTQTDFGLERPVRSFANSGVCLRVSTYRSLPGFEPMFFHMYEEPDYALQCVANGWDVRFCPQVTIRHHWVGRERSEMTNHQRHARNELWSTVMRCPMPQALAMVIYRMGSQARYAAKRGLGWLVREPVWWWQALRGVPQALGRRSPVSWEGYLRWLRWR